MKTILCIGLMAFAPAIWAEEFSTTLKQENLQEAIRFQKEKDAADEAQARKESGQGRSSATADAKKSKVTASKTNRSDTDHKTSQADSPKK